MNRRFFSALTSESSKNYGFLTVATFSYDFTMILNFNVQNYCVIYIESTINLLHANHFTFLFDSLQVRPSIQARLTQRK